MSWILRLNTLLRGAPDTLLTWLLIGLAVVALLVAFYGKPVLKAAVAAWMLLP